MANPTTNLGMTKPTVGGSTDTWGTTINENVVDILDAVFASSGTAISLGAVSVDQLTVIAQGDLRLADTTGGQYVALQAHGTTTNYTLTMPAAVGSTNQVLSAADGSGTLAWTTPGGGMTGVTAGAGMTGGGTSGVVTLNVIGTADKVTVSADAVTIASTYVGQSSITTLGTIGSLVATTADINGGTLDGATVGASSASTGAFTTLTASSTLAVTGDVTIGGATTTNSIVTSSNGAADVLRIWENTGDNTHRWAWYRSGGGEFRVGYHATTGSPVSADKLKISSSGLVTIPGILSVTDSTQSTTTGTGSINTLGGLGVAKDVFIGGDINIPTAQKIIFAAAGTTHISDDSGRMVFTMSGGNDSFGFQFKESANINTAVDHNFLSVNSTVGFEPTSGSGAYTALELAPTVNGTGNSGDLAILRIAPTLTAWAGANKYLIQAGTAASGSLFTVDSTGEVKTEAGVYAMKETTTPAAVTDWGRIYAKADNKIYFQDGAGTEHEIAFA